MALLAEAITDNPQAVAILKRFGLLAADGSWRISNVDFEGLGEGPILDPAVIEKFATLDQTANLRVLAWMLLWAGGGPEKLEGSETQLKAAHDYWVQERVAGRGEQEQPIPPMSQEQAEAAWKEVEPGMKLSLYCADADTLEMYNHTVFGYQRLWPGQARIYEEVFDAVRSFLNYTRVKHGGKSQVSLINQARQQRALAPETAGQNTYVPVETDPSKYPSLAALQQANTEFRFYFHKKKELKNITYIGKGPQGYVRGGDVKLYEDENVVVYVPATAAAMMKVGFENWCVANKTEFEDAFKLHKPKPPRWTEYQGYGPLCVIILKKDVVEPDRPEGHEHYRSIAKIAVHLRDCDISALEEPYKGVQFFDRENRNFPKPVDWPELLGRLQKIPDSGPLIQSVRAAMQEFVTWAKQMQPGDIKASVYERLAAVLVWNMLHED